MAKVNFNKLSRGQPLTPAAIWDNLDQAATALSGNISKEQRAQGRSVFSVSLQRVRFSDAIWNDYDQASDPTLNSLNEVLRPEAFIFALPPLQEFFNSQLIDTIEAPDIILESLAVSFDNMNQQFPTVLDEALPSTINEKFNRSLTVTIEAYKEDNTGLKPGTIVGKAGIPLTTFNLPNETIINKPNPAVTANIGNVIGGYDYLKVSVVSPIEIDYATIPAGAAMRATGIDNLHVHATFSAPIVQRDNAAYSVVPQNAPLHDCARSPRSNVLTRPVQGTDLQAEDSTNFDGVQDAFSQLDRQVRERLSGGLTRWSEVRENSESLLEDQGYFCWMIPLFNIAEDEGLTNRADRSGAAARFYNAATRPSVADFGYIRENPDTSLDAFMDKAVIPIVAPGTIHHIGVFWDKMYVDDTTGVLDPRLYMDFGVALGTKPKAEVSQYTQVSYVTGRDVSWSASAPLNHFWAPIVRSTAAGAPPAGSGYVAQGRPFYFGREVDYTGGVIRRNVAGINPIAAEAAPNTNGLEQFLEVRCNINLYDVTTAQYKDMSSLGGPYPLVVGNGSGVVVCIYGKMALVE